VRFKAYGYRPEMQAKLDGLYSVFMWMMNHIVLGFFGAVEKTLVGCGLGIVRLLERQKQ